MKVLSFRSCPLKRESYCNSSSWSITVNCVRPHVTVPLCCLGWGGTSEEVAVPGEDHHQFQIEEGVFRKSTTCTLPSGGPLTSDWGRGFQEVAPSKVLWGVLERKVCHVRCLLWDYCPKFKSIGVLNWKLLEIHSEESILFYFIVLY